MVKTDDLEKLYECCDIPADQWSLLTSLLEKLAVLDAASS